MQMDFPDSGRRNVGAAGARPENNLLRALRDDDHALIAAALEPTDLPAGGLIYNSGDNVDFVHFPCGASLASFLVGNVDGRDVETVLVGREGAVGGIVSRGRLPAYCRIVVKHPGRFVRLDTGVADQIWQADPNQAIRPEVVGTWRRDAPLSLLNKFRSHPISIGNGKTRTLDEQLSQHGYSV